MGAFIHVETSERFDGVAGSSTAFVGQIVGRPRESFVDYELRALRGSSRWRSVATLGAYPRWSEPALALFVRLLVCTPATLLSGPAPAWLRVRFSVGPFERMGRVEEVLEVDVEAARRRACFRSFFKQVRRDLGPAPGNSLRDVVRCALHATLDWGDTMPPAPASLLSVPVRRDAAGIAVVHLADVPDHTVPYLLRAAALTPAAHLLPAHFWYAFLGTPPPDEDQT